MSRLEPPPTRPSFRLLPLLLAVLTLAVLPWLSSWYESGALSRSPRETWSSSAASAIAIAFGVWLIVLLRRERDTNQRHLADLEALTLTDPLTGLGNRRALERELARTMLRSRRLDHALALLYMDVDDLKQVNDRFGHAAGDDTLRALAHAVRQCSREGTDTGYRVGGDEFVVIVLAGRAGAEMLARRIDESFHGHSPHENRLSLGVVEWDGALTAGELLNEADRQMYRNKHMAHRAGAPASGSGER
jgi:diguanylate cyclase (GGDEF)-like protein